MLIAMVILTLPAFSQGAQKDTSNRERKNIISVDLTALLRQFSNAQTNFYGSPYYIAYRRVIKNCAIKLQAGGEIYTNNTVMNDSIKGMQSRNMLNLALGFEHYTYLGKRWTLYHGVDLTYAYLGNTYVNDRTTTNSYESKDHQNNYGLAPALGIVFKITDRISIGTETSYNVSYMISKTERLEIPNSQYNRVINETGIQSQFIPPTAINLRLKF